MCLGATSGSSATVIRLIGFWTLQLLELDRDWDLIMNYKANEIRCNRSQHHCHAICHNVYDDIFSVTSKSLSWTFFRMRYADCTFKCTGVLRNGLRSAISRNRRVILPRCFFFLVTRPDTRRGCASTIEFWWSQNCYRHGSELGLRDFFLFLPSENALRGLCICSEMTCGKKRGFDCLGFCPSLFSLR